MPFGIEPVTVSASAGGVEMRAALTANPTAIKTTTAIPATATRIEALMLRHEFTKPNPSDYVSDFPIATVPLSGPAFEVVHPQHGDKRGKSARRTTYGRG